MEENVKQSVLPEQAASAPSEAEGAQTVQTLSVEESCRLLTEYLGDILRDAQRASLDTDRLSEPCRELGNALQSFHTVARELIDYSTQLSKGNLTQKFPAHDSCLYSGLKNLHSGLNHLTWQARQVAKGDYTQRVSYLGKFSEAFNSMTQQLKEREAQLKDEIKRAQRRAVIIESYTEMLVELLSQREEWLLIVDAENREIVYCNKRPQDGAAPNTLCNDCKQRLPIQEKLLEYSDLERYKIWEVEEQKNACYRIVSFPIEWKERPSFVHIVMDIAAEKMNARHLNAQMYHDNDTGIRNRLFLDEFMERALAERQDITLCYLDLEGVDEINKAYGRRVGDAYIQNFVEIVRKNFRSGDTFARIRDDRFCLILTGNVKYLIERKMAEILDAFQRDDDRIFSHRCNFRFSIVEVAESGVEVTLDDLIKKAETAIKVQKRRRKSFDPDNW